jgi:hypothetical protein
MRARKWILIGNGEGADRGAARVHRKIDGALANRKS